MKLPDLDYLSIKDRLRAHVWYLFFKHDQTDCEKLRRRSNERLREYYSFDVLFIPRLQPGFTNTTLFHCTECVGTHFGYSAHGPESWILEGYLSAPLLDTIDNNIYQDLLRKTDLRLVEKIS
jgi:hypothetical protein